MSLLPSVSFGQDRGNDQWWVMLFYRGPVWGEKWLGYFEYQPRLSNSFDKTNAIMHRHAYGYQFFEKHSFWIGHAYLNTYVPRNFDEHRTFLQWFHKTKLSGYKANQQFRIEQRKFSLYRSVSHRLRYKFRVLQPIYKQYGINFAFQNEFFYNINTVAADNKSGPEQNRFYIGLNKSIGKNGHSVEAAITRTIRFIKNDTNVLTNFFVLRYTWTP